MIKKLRRRYVITNMILLSCTLMVALAILFGVLYRYQVESSYSTMNELLKESELPPSAPPKEHNRPDPTANDAAADQPSVVLLAEESQGGNDQWWQNNPYWGNPAFMPPPYWMPPFDPNQLPPWMQQNPGQENSQQPNDPNQNQGQNPWEGWWGGQNPPQEQSQAEPEPPKQSESGENRRNDDRNRRTESSRQEQPRRQEHSQPGSEQTTTAPPAELTTTEAATTHETTKTTASTTKKQTTTSASKTTAKTTASTSAETTTTEAVVAMDEGHFIPDAYVAKIDGDGNIESYAGNADQQPGEEHFKRVHHAMDSIRKKGSESGTIELDDVPYRYLYQKDDSGSYHLVLMNRTLEISSLTKMLILFAVLAIIGLIAMFGLSNLLASWTVTPIADAWEKQKQFVADASHELKTPLAVISANTEVILANPAQQVQDQKKWLNYIQSETMRMSKLITNLLTVARMDQKNQPAKTADPLPLSETVSNICLVFEPVVYEHGKTLNTVIQRNVRMQADEDNIKQLLSILLDNAILHSVPKAEITVSLSKDAQNKIRLSVANTAEDIPQEQLVHLFDRFYRLDTEGSPNGSGLGLSIAKSIVQQMNGSLTVTSENRTVTFVAAFSS